MPFSTKSLKTMRNLLLAGAATLLLTACSTASPTGLSADDLIPQALTTCATAPAVPDRPAPNAPRTDQQKADYLSDLHGAWSDCHDTVAAVKVQHDLLAKQFPPKPAQGFHFPAFRIPFLH